MDNRDPIMLADFILVTRGHLANVALRLRWLETSLERASSNAAALYGIWRSFYSIKCLASFLGLSALAEAAYQIETALLPARTGELAISDRQVQAISQAAGDLEYRVNTLRDPLTAELV